MVKIRGLVTKTSRVAEGQTGRPVSPAPSIEGDVNEAEQINVVFPDGEDPVTMTHQRLHAGLKYGGGGRCACDDVCLQIPTECIAPLAERQEGFNGGQVMIYNSASADGSGAIPEFGVEAEDPSASKATQTIPLSDSVLLRGRVPPFRLYDPDRAQDRFNGSRERWSKRNTVRSMALSLKRWARIRASRFLDGAATPGIAISRAM